MDTDLISDDHDYDDFLDLDFTDGDHESVMACADGSFLK
jgi:hypothetical protein